MSACSSLTYEVRVPSVSPLRLKIPLHRQQAGVFDSINFCHPPRGILTLDEDVVITKSPRSDADGAGDVALIIQGNGQRWKLGSEVPGEISRWEEVGAGNMCRARHTWTVCYNYYTRTIENSVVERESQSPLSVLTCSPLTQLSICCRNVFDSERPDTADMAWIG